MSSRANGVLAPNNVADAKTGITPRGIRMVASPPAVRFAQPPCAGAPCASPRRATRPPDHDAAPNQGSRPSAHASTVGRRILRHVNAPTAILMPATVSAITRDAMAAVRSALRMSRLIQSPFAPSIASMPSTKSAATNSACVSPAEPPCREREQRRLRHGVERQREQHPDGGHRPCPPDIEKAPKQPRPEARRGHNRMGSSQQHRADIEKREPEQEDHRDRGAGDLEPCRRLPARCQRSRDQRDEHHDNAMPQREQRVGARASRRLAARCSASTRRSSPDDRRRSRGGRRGRTASAQSASQVPGTARCHR